jgi:PRTRC genetic system protein C
MATRARPIVRVFMFKGVALQDPFPGRPLTVVRRVHQTQYAAITNAKLDGPEYRGNQEVYTYRPEAGVNG